MTSPDPAKAGSLTCLTALVIAGSIAWAGWTAMSATGGAGPGTEPSATIQWVASLHRVTFFPPPAAGDVLLQSGMLGGQALYPVSGEAVAMNAGDFTLVGRVDDGHWFLYQAADPELNTGPVGEVYFFVQTSPGQYFRLTTTPPEIRNS